MTKSIKKLSVRLYGKEIGILEERSGKMRFKYNEDATIPLSLSLPIKEDTYSEKQCKGYFGGLLPESDETKRAIAMQYKINMNNDFALLAAIGRDCAGAVSFHSLEEPEVDESSLRIDGDAVSDEELARHINNLPKKPLSLGRKLSLAGAQEKTPVTVIEGDIRLAKINCPTTHILKPAINSFEQSVANEYICMSTAKECGLRVPSIETRTIQDVDFFLIERYDRHIEGESIRRLQQEDFAQALGIWTGNKYEVTVKDCAKVLTQLSKPAISKAQFVEQFVFNYLIGNCDAHGKNFSIVYKENGEVELSPVYDVLCTRVYEELDSNMAMKIGRNDYIEKVSIKDWHLFAKELDIAPAFVEQRIMELSARLPIGLEKIVKELNFEIGYKILDFAVDNCHKAQGKLA